MIKVMHLKQDPQLSRDSESFDVVFNLKMGMNDRLLGVINNEYPGISYEHVANIKTEDLESAFILSNSISAPWFHENKDKVEMIGEYANGCRSTSVGDIMVRENDSMHFVSTIGFEKLFIEATKQMKP